MYKLRSKIPNGSSISPYWENNNTHFLNLQGSTQPPLYLPHLQDGNEAETSEIVA